MNLTWAVNPSKANRALADVTASAKLDSSVVVNEDAVKARYVELGGLLQEGVVVVKKVSKKKKAVDEDEE